MSESITIGARGSADINVDDEYVSNRHALVTRHADGNVTVEDLGSTNGTYLNGLRVYGERPLRAGDRLRVGRTEVTLPAALWPS